MLTVTQLKAILKELPEDMPVRYEDPHFGGPLSYAELTVRDLKVVNGELLVSIPTIGTLE